MQANRAEIFRRAARPERRFAVLMIGALVVATAVTLAGVPGQAEHAVCRMALTGAAVGCL
ncbi:hypothetical protein SAMN04488103_10854 [Gemmobacter aquatilis]|uniref:Uncharacterized protein n=1 Tax=Gemmobacter aquatilis TaxID=933059 RepID=A0A1H8JP61_9RHOB|nr:hypothetical protein [Gemmobacter aquatilis]SEN82147.1 hypothetical protein SAMN04488103_10854 [Gemmobacter aquatilis]